MRVEQAMLFIYTRDPESQNNGEDFGPRLAAQMRPRARIIDAAGLGLGGSGCAATRQLL